MRVKIVLLAAFLGAFACAAPAQERLSAWISGGIGREERAAMSQHRDEFNLQLVFVQRRSGAYLAQVDTLIGDAEGRILLRARSEGPFLYARLAPGAYRVAATFRGRTESRRVAVAAGRPTIVTLYWEEGD